MALPAVLAISCFLSCPTRIAPRCARGLKSRHLSTAWLPKSQRQWPCAVGWMRFSADAERRMSVASHLKGECNTRTGYESACAKAGVAAFSDQEITSSYGVDFGDFGFPEYSPETVVQIALARHRKTALEAESKSLPEQTSQKPKSPRLGQHYQRHPSRPGSCGNPASVEMSPSTCHSICAPTAGPKAKRLNHQQPPKKKATPHRGEWPFLFMHQHGCVPAPSIEATGADWFVARVAADFQHIAHSDGFAVCFDA